VKLFNTTTKRFTIRRSFKYLSDVEPTSTTFIIPVEPEEASIQSSVSTTSSDAPSQDLPDENEFLFAPVSNAKAYQFLNNTFLDKSTETQYMIHYVVRLSTPLVKNVYCFRYFSFKDFTSAPEFHSDFEYQPIDEFLQGPNYVLPDNIQTRPSAKFEE
jgi:hypothetical protein